MRSIGRRYLASVLGSENAPAKPKASNPHLAARASAPKEPSATVASHDEPVSAPSVPIVELGDSHVEEHVALAVHVVPSQDDITAGNVCLIYCFGSTQSSK